MASAKRRTGNSSGSGDRSINCWARSAVCSSPWLCGIRMARDSMATVSASSARVAAGRSAIAARLPADREPLDGELGVEQPQGEVLAADSRPQRTRG